MAEEFDLVILGGVLVDMLQLLERAVGTKNSRG